MSIEVQVVERKLIKEKIDKLATAFDEIFARVRSQFSCYATRNRRMDAIL